MSKLNFSVFLNTYSDNIPSNNPNMSNVKWYRELNGLIVADASSQSATLAPGENLSLFSGMRALLQDGTTRYSITLVPFSTNTYTLSAVSGTLPNFRTPRTTGADATTQIFTSVNGPIETFTSGAGTFASFTGQLPGMISPVTITANSVGTAGNSVILTADGTSSIATLISNWNTANPSNMITLTTGNGTQIPNNTGMYASYVGTIMGTATPVTITANTIGAVGNSVVLTGDGSSSISMLITAWNTANPSNQITLTTGDGTQVPTGPTYASYAGTITGTITPVTITANVGGTNGNNVVITGDGSSNIDTLIANWNIQNPSNTVTLTAGIGTQVPSDLAIANLMDGTNPAVVDLAGGVNPNSLQLSGGSSSTSLNLISGGVVVGDYVTIGTNFNASNQGTFQIVALTANSFSIVNPAPTIEGPITLGSGFATQLQIYSAAGVQIGDTLVISGGFSPVTQGSYAITAVTANTLQFYTTSPIPQESNILTEAIAIYSEAKQLVYIEADSTTSVIINGVTVGNIQPFIVPGIIGSTTKPGMFMLKSTIYSLSLQNNGVNPANIFFAAVE